MVVPFIYLYEQYGVHQAHRKLHKSQECNKKGTAPIASEFPDRSPPFVED